MRAALRGYHKPIMIAGGVGNVRRMHVEKSDVPPGAKVVVLGGPAMLIGLGGGAASSVGSGASAEDLDFASVQRGNPEIQPRAQEVIDQCWGLGEANPILLIHDVGAGGLSNAIPESIAHSHRGGRIDLRTVPSVEPGMSPLEIWCNEAQERYVLAVSPQSLPLFREICERERCPFSVVGEATDDGRLLVTDSLLKQNPVDVDLALILGKPPKMLRDVQRLAPARRPLALQEVTLAGAVHRVMRHPAVAECSVVGRKHPEWGEEVVAFVVARGPIGAGELDLLCLENMARYKRPRDYRFVDALPKNNYGKVLKTELRKLC